MTLHPPTPPNIHRKFGGSGFTSACLIYNIRTYAVIAYCGEMLMLDFDNYANWYWEVQECRLLKQVSATEYYVYLVHRAPYGIPNRDVILHAIIEPQTSKKPYVLLTVKAAPNYLPVQPKLVRMPAENMTIKFMPLANNIVQIEAEGFIDPAGKVPAWDANLIQRNAPYAVTLGLQRMALQEKYAQSHSELPFPVYNYDSLP